MVIEVKSDEEFNQLINSNDYLASIVNFKATWCPKCIMIEPLFKELSTIYTDIQFIKLDVDRLSLTTKNSNVRATPTFIIYKNGMQTSEKIVGADDKKMIKLMNSISSKDKIINKTDLVETKHMNVKTNINENDKHTNTSSLKNVHEKSYEHKVHHMLVLLAIFIGYFVFTLYEMK
jgi:thioredoxin 1